MSYTHESNKTKNKMSCCSCCVSSDVVVTDSVSSARDSSNAPDNPIECPDGWKRVTPPVNPQLGCLPDNIKSN